MVKKNYKKAEVSKFHKYLYLCMILGQIACGYALNIAGIAVTQAQEALGLNTFWVGLLGAGTLIGLAGSLLVGNISDKIGRSRLLLLDMTIFALISILQYFTSNVGVLLILRIGLGLCIAEGGEKVPAKQKKWNYRENKKTQKANHTPLQKPCLSLKLSPFHEIIDKEYRRGFLCYQTKTSNFQC